MENKITELNGNFDEVIRPEINELISGLSLRAFEKYQILESNIPKTETLLHNLLNSAYVYTVKKWEKDTADNDWNGVFSEFSNAIQVLIYDWISTPAFTRVADVYFYQSTKDNETTVLFKDLIDFFCKEEGIKSSWQKDEINEYSINMTKDIDYLNSKFRFELKFNLPDSCTVTYKDTMEEVDNIVKNETDGKYYRNVKKAIVECQEPSMIKALNL